MKRPAKVQNIFNTNKLNYKIMKTRILKKAVLINKGVWTTTITWASILRKDDGSLEEVGTTCVITEQTYHRCKEHSYKKIEKFNHNEFEIAYDAFHQKLKDWM